MTEQICICQHDEIMHKKNNGDLGICNHRYCECKKFEEDLK